MTVERRASIAWIAGPPIFLAAVLSLPCLGLGYFWAAIARMAQGDRPGASRLMAEAPGIPRDYALYCVSKVMAEPTGRAAVDSCAYAAFGVSGSDPGALRYLMEVFYASLFVPQAVQFAQRLQEVTPGDSESAAILSELR